jgi:ADP-ribose pyrophosphatase YjhB (NUDIX family)
MHDRAASLDAGTCHRTAARDGERMAIRSNGGDWSIAWFPPTMVPEGMRHGANVLCVAGDGGLVVISNDGERWGWPGGRPEGDESWEQKLRRAILEETCAVVRDARFLGFCWAACVAGPETHRVLVRSIWRADVELLRWQPRFEITHRRIVPAAEVLSHLWMEEGFALIYMRALIEAGLMKR